MALNLRKTKKQTLFITQTPSFFNLNNGQLFHRHRHPTTTELRSFDQRQITSLRERGRKQVRLLYGSSMPLSPMLYPTYDRSLHSPHYQVPFILPHPSPLSRLQEKMLASYLKVCNSRVSLLPDFDLYVNSRAFSRVPSVLPNLDSQSNSVLHFHSRVSLLPNFDSHRKLLYVNSRAFSWVPSVWPNFDSHRKLLYVNSRAFSWVPCVLPNFDSLAKVLHFNSRGFCRVTDCDTESDAESEGDNVEGKCENVNSNSDLKEVDRVCKVIDELFALDRNMEAVLDDCGINLTHDLIVDVLERFRHARRPAFRFFCWAGQKPGFNHDSRTYNRMMAILGKTRQFETMVAVLEEMGEKGLLTMETFEISIKAFVAARERKKAVGIFELMKKYKFKTGVDTINCLLDSLGRVKLGKEGQALFEKLKGRFTPNLRTYTVMLNGWCRVKNLMEAGKVWNEMIDKGFKPDIVAHNTMLDGLVRSKKRSDAIKLFEVMKAKGPCPNVQSYTILIKDLCTQTKMKEAVEYFEEMIDSGCEPDAAVYTCLITGFGNQKKMDKVYGLLKEMKEKGCPPDGRLYNALIKLMTNRQMPDDAVWIYKKMIQSGIQPTIHTYNMMMKSYFQTKNYDMGFAAWEEMNRKGCCPDDNSYIVFIGGLIRQGRSVEACKYLEEMIEKGMKAPQLDYNKFAADFSRAGKAHILEELAQKMNFSGKFEVSNFFARWAEMMKKRVKRREPI